MRRKLGKLALAVSVLAGGLVLGVSPREASAGFTCAPICCDTGCTLTRSCRFVIPTGCVCSPYCIGN